MKPSPSYLFKNRHGTFYFRIVIPAPLRPLINGKREIRRSLKTDSQRLAIKRARQFAVRYETAFDKAISSMTTTRDGNDVLTEEDIKLLEELDLPAAGAWSDPPSNIPPEPVLTDEQIEARQRRREVERLLTGAYGRAIPAVQEPLAQRLLALSSSYQPTELRQILPRLRDELIKSAIAPAPAPAPAPTFDPAMADWTLYQVWQHQLERDRADIAATGGQARHGGTLEERERRARVMTVLTQHKPVCQLSKRDWQAAYDAARRMKAGVTVSVAPDPQTPLAELLTDDPALMTGHERTTAVIASIKQLQTYARFLELTTISPDDLDTPPIQERTTAGSRSSKAIFTPSDLEKIFSGWIYQGDIPRRTKAYPFWYWLPLVAYFTGARTGEITQLDTADIRAINGHPCFDFCEDDPKAFEAKRIKTGEARQVPIHPCLIELGFLDYVASQAQDRQKKLFGDGLTYMEPRHDTDANKEGWTKRAGKFFNEAPDGYLVTTGVHQPRDGKSIYSFRHTLVTILRNAERGGQELKQTLINAITGHREKDVQGRHYDNGPTIELKLDALLLMPVPEAIQRLKGYKPDFADRFGDTLTKSIASHRSRYPRTV